MLHRQILRRNEVRNIYRKVKKIIHNNLSPASGDKSVHKITFSSKFEPFLPRERLFA